MIKVIMLNIFLLSPALPWALMGVVCMVTNDWCIIDVCIGFTVLLSHFHSKMKFHDSMNKTVLKENSIEWYRWWGWGALGGGCPFS